jgi:hypothetical protein
MKKEDSNYEYLNRKGRRRGSGLNGQADKPNPDMGNQLKNLVKYRMKHGIDN